MKCYEVIEYDDMRNTEEVILQTLDYEEALAEYYHQQINNPFDYIWYGLYDYEF